MSTNIQSTANIMPQSKALKLRVPGQNFEAYMAAIRKIPVLSPEQERELALRHFDEEDLDAARQMVLSHLRFVVHIARTYNGYGLPLSDLVQEGNVGLMKAVKRFDPYVGVHLVSFAVHWIRAEIHEYIIRNWRIVKVATTKAQRKLFFNLRSSTTKPGWLNDEEVKRIAQDLGVQPSDVREMEARMSMQERSFDGSKPSNSEDEGDSFIPANYIEDRRYNPSEDVESNDWSNKTTQALRQAIEDLDPRSRDILEQRWLNETSKVTLHDLAKKYQVSAERVRQLEVAAMSKIRQTITTLDSTLIDSAAFS